MLRYLQLAAALIKKVAFWFKMCYDYLKDSIRGADFIMTRIKNVKHQWAISYVVLMLIPTVIFLSILGVLEKSVKEDVYHADELVLNTVKKELDTCFYSMKMTYLKLEYDTNLRKLLSGNLTGREKQLQIASDVLFRTRETTVFDGLEQKIYIALPESDIAICSDSGIADVDSVTRISFNNLDYSHLEALVGDKSYGDFFVIDVLNNGISEKALAYVGQLPMAPGPKSKGLAVVWIDMDYFLGENGILTSIKDRNAALVNQKGEVVFSTSEETDIDMMKKAQGSYEKNGAIISFISLENADWYGVISAPRAVILKRLFRVKLLIVLGIVLCLICGMMGIVFLLKHNYSPLQKLLERLTEKNEKNINNSEMNEYDVLHKNISRILEQTKQMQKTVDRQNKTLRETYLSRLLAGRYSPELLETVDEPPAFLSEDFAVVLFKMENVGALFPDSEMSSESRCQTAQLIITNIMEELIGERHCGYVVPYRDCLAGIISLSSAAAALEKSLSEIIKDGLDAIYQNFQLIVQAALSDIHKSYYGIYEGCREAEDILEYVDFSGSPAVFQLSDLQSVSDYYYPSDVDAQLTKAIVSGNYSVAADVLNEVFQKNPANGGLVKHGNKYVLLRVITALFSAAGEDVQYQHTSEIMKLVENGVGWSQLEQRLLALAEKLCRESVPVKSAVSSLTDRVRAYLDEHYIDNNISIQLLGDYFGMSPYYLSKIFKNELGIAFGDYLRRIRVEHVKVLLEREESIRLKDAAIQVGFSDARALKRAFLQEVGILPSEYLSRVKSK